MMSRKNDFLDNIEVICKHFLKNFYKRYDDEIVVYFKNGKSAKITVQTISKKEKQNEKFNRASITKR